MRAPPNRLRPWLHPRVIARWSAVFALLAGTHCVDSGSPGVGGGSPGKQAPDASGPPAPRVATAPSNGFNDAIAWRSLEDGLAESANTSMPLMLVVHASWCGSCKRLKPKFQDARLAEVSNKFVMVNSDQDLVPAVHQYVPDGSYVPRVLFFDPQTGELDPDLLNPDRSRNLYYYGPKDDLVAIMEKALERHGNKTKS